MPKATTDTIDYDGLVKDFITQFFDQFIKLVNLALYDAVDWGVAPTFLEQELINALKGRYKIKGKRKVTDKLAKVRLKNGIDHYVLIHTEFQHQIHDDFPKRMLVYRSLIFLRYDVEDISAIALFTGPAPDKTHLFYHRNTFGTELTYRYHCYVAIEQQEQVLIQSDNPVALAMLAMQYAEKTLGKPEERLGYKKALFELAAQKGIEREQLIKLLIFVRDFVRLPQKLENEFERDVFDHYLPVPVPMQMSQGTKNFADKLYERVFGINPKKMRREAREATQREREAREAAQREREVRETAIVKLHRQFGISVEKLAELFNCEPAYVQNVLQTAANNP